MKSEIRDSGSCLATGDAIAFVRTQMETEAGLGDKYTFSGSVYFERLKQKGLFTLALHDIRERVAKARMSGNFS